jgi:hypothetical protein
VDIGVIVDTLETRAVVACLAADAVNFKMLSIRVKSLVVATFPGF